jgi:hypothetical protein
MFRRDRDMGRSRRPAVIAVVVAAVLVIVLAGGVGG